ncbi:MAG: cytochrome ubiquinol oxidase subunit I [Bacteroidales bacterium]|nr:cytochrome ubiquinol oxidase subunit I [Bacteroidales bacterium]
MNILDTSLVELVNWSRAQFALTAIYHWFFVPLTIGLSFILAICETIYVKTGNENWAKITRYWMQLFAINFAIGVATGIVLEFEFGTNWANYSWIAGDIFGAPLAIEGIMAFFLESTFIGVMLFGWNKISKKMHLLATWLVAIGSNLSAYWILVANAWMNNPVGTKFNPDMARNEMTSFFEIAFSPFAINKFLHTVSSCYLVSALFVLGVSSWYLLKNRNVEFAKKSILIGSIFGLFASILIIITGHSSAQLIAEKQPMKLAAMEGLYNGKKGADLIVFGVLKDRSQLNNDADSDPFIFKISIPKLLSFLAFEDFNSFVPGINDILYGNKEHNIKPITEKIEKGKIAISALQQYREALKASNKQKMDEMRKVLNENYKYIGYGYFKNIEHLIPNVFLVFYSFHIMVALGFYFVLVFIVALWLLKKNSLQNKKLLLRLFVFNIFLGFIASQLGWVVAEVGRQPWVIQDILPVFKATSHLSVKMVQTTFFIFLILFTILLLAEIKILLHKIRKTTIELN